MNARKIILIITATLAAILMHQRAGAQIFAAKVNALSAITGTLNVGIDISLADKWTLDVAAYWNPINSAKYSSRILGVQVGAKRWFYESFVGHFVGAQFTYGNYLWGGSRRYWKGRAAGLGISYGYAWLLSKRWNITVEAGIGIYHMRDTRHERHTPDFEPIHILHARRWAVGPSRAEVSFNYLF